MEGEGDGLRAGEGSGMGSSCTRYTEFPCLSGGIETLKFDVLPKPLTCLSSLVVALV